MSDAPGIIAIDGPAAAGKGTLAKRLAGHFRLALLDTGLLYRAVAAGVLDAGVEVSGDPENYAETATRIAGGLAPKDLQGDRLRSDDTAQAASRVSALPDVRAALLAFQRDFATRPPDGAAGAVLDGRDIGTVVCPEADVKLFITAATEIRARRRLKELQNRGVEAIYARVLEDMRERDARDAGRDVSPLVAAADAFRLDTSDLDADQALAAALDFINSRNA